MAKDKAAADDESGGKKSGKLKLIAMVLPVLLLVGGGVYFFMFSGSSSETSASASEDGEEYEDGEEGEEGDGPSPSSTYVPGAIVVVDPVTINLAAGHYLKVGVALQATADAGEEVPPGKAADALISQFSGKTVEELSTTEGREAAKEELTKTIKKRYEKKVYEIYYTTFVMN